MKFDRTKQSIETIFSRQKFFAIDRMTSEDLLFLRIHLEILQFIAIHFQQTDLQLRLPIDNIQINNFTPNHNILLQFHCQRRANRSFTQTQSQPQHNQEQQPTLLHLLFSLRHANGLIVNQQHSFSPLLSSPLIQWHRLSTRKKHALLSLVLSLPIHRALVVSLSLINSKTDSRNEKDHSHQLSSLFLSFFLWTLINRRERRRKFNASARQITGVCFLCRSDQSNVHTPHPHPRHRRSMSWTDDLQRTEPNYLFCYFSSSSSSGWSSCSFQRSKRKVIQLMPTMLLLMLSLSHGCWHWRGIFR